MARAAKTPRPNYESDPAWADIIPIPQNEGSPYPLAAIAYTDEYSQAMSYLRAVMANNEISERVLQLTDHIIHLNPAHYTVWLFRCQTLDALGVDPLDELKWLDKVALKHLKNYQIWHHRQTIMSKLTTLPDTELAFISRMLAKDAKNYHVWSYRIWLVRHFNMWPTLENPGSELDFTEDLLTKDVMNNSAWNHRYFVCFGRQKRTIPDTFDPKSVPDEVWEREIDLVKIAIRHKPQNQASWNYLIGIVKKKRDGIEALENFASIFADIDKPKVRSSFALDLLAQIYGRRGEVERAKKAYTLLAERYDPIRRFYWRHLMDELDGKNTEVVDVYAAMKAQEPWTGPVKAQEANP